MAGIAVTIAPPLENVVITASPGGETATTNAMGYAWLNTGTGTFTITGILAGYTITEGSLSVIDQTENLELNATTVLGSDNLVTAQYSELYAELWAPVWEKLA